MSNWFTRRAKEAMGNEQGFTLIELLVVVIIVGILASIAIPTFLAQRTRAQDAAAQSDLRNMAASATACSAANNGSYATCDRAALVDNYDFHASDDVTTAVTEKTATSWKATAVNTKGGATYAFDTATGKVVKQ